MLLHTCNFNTRTQRARNTGTQQPTYCPPDTAQDPVSTSQVCETKACHIPTRDFLSGRLPSKRLIISLKAPILTQHWGLPYFGLNTLGCTNVFLEAKDSAAVTLGHGTIHSNLLLIGQVGFHIGAVL